MTSRKPGMSRATVLGSRIGRRLGMTLCPLAVQKGEADCQPEELGCIGPDLQLGHVAVLSTGKRRQQNCRKDTDDCNDDKQFDECKTFFTHNRTPYWVRPVNPLVKINFIHAGHMNFKLLKCNINILYLI